MKKLFVLSMLISFAMVCSCQKQDSAAEQQLAQRKAELDAREKTLDEREKALAERERAMASRRVKPADVQPQGTIRDPAQVKAERDRRIQQLPPELQLQGLIADPSRDKADSHFANSVSCGTGYFTVSIAYAVVNSSRYLGASAKTGR